MIAALLLLEKTAGGGGGHVLCHGRTVISRLRPQPWAGDVVSLADSPPETCSPGPPATKWSSSSFPVGPSVNVYEAFTGYPGCDHIEPRQPWQIVVWLCSKTRANRNVGRCPLSAQVLQSLV